MCRPILAPIVIGVILLCTPAGYSADPQKIPADASKGFSWPYYLLIPEKITSPPVLFVEPNNSGTPSDDQAFHDASAKSLIQSKTWWASDLGTPYLVPVFPRPASGSDASTYTHALDRRALLTKTPDLERLDLQLIAMISDAQSRLASLGITVDSKVFMVGASASGSFTSRFVMLHPDMVKAASFGCPSFGPIVPASSWNGQNLPYPEGIADLESLVGAKFDIQTFKNVPLQVWVGDEDYNMDPWWILSDPEVALVSAAFGGKRLYERWPKYEAVYTSVSPLCQFLVVPTLGHAWLNWTYMREFFSRYRVAPPPPLPKPFLYKIYFPHVAAVAPWENELGLTNTSEVPVQGRFETYGPDGGPAIESVQLTLGPLERKEIIVGSFFLHPQNVAYVAFVSDSGFLAGYTRFSQPGNRVSLAAGTGSTRGWFTKIEKDGWTGVAFVNVETTHANVSLAAMDAEGNQLSSATLTLPPGKKYVSMVQELFAGDLSKATFFKYTSDKRLLGFTVSGSADGQMLDGLHCLGQYSLSP